MTIISYVPFLWYLDVKCVVDVVDKCPDTDVFLSEALLGGVKLWK